MDAHRPADLDTSSLRVLTEFRRELTGAPTDAKDRMRHAVLNGTLHNRAGGSSGLLRFPHSRPTALPEIAVQHRPEVESPGQRLPSWAWRSGFATLGAAALMVGAITVGITGQATPPAGIHAAQQPPPSGLVAQSFELAAMHAETEPFTPPRPDQWTYVEVKMVRGKGAEQKGQKRNETTRSWVRADGRQSAEMIDGKLHILPETLDPPRTWVPQDYRTLAGLPTEPQALLDWLRARDSTGQDDKAQRDAASFNMINSMLRENVLPPRLKATLLRVLALIPGVTQSVGPVDFDGRPAIAVGMVQDGWRREDILLDPATHEFLGSRTVVVKDHTLYPPAGEGRQPGGRPDDLPPGARPEGTGRAVPEEVRLKEGDVEVELIRVTGKIVDAPGQTN